jgi:transcriptional antiterminator RfaH
MKQLLLRCDEEGFIVPPPEVSPGDKVRLARGPFSEFLARVERINERKRIWILLDKLDGLTEVEVKIEDLIKDDAA